MPCERSRDSVSRRAFRAKASFWRVRLRARAVFYYSLREVLCYECHTVFHLCAPHYLCQLYCSAPCRAALRRLSVHAALRLYRQHPLALLYHRDRQRSYRACPRQVRSVVYQSPQKLAPSGSVPADAAPSTPMTREEARRQGAPYARPADPELPTYPVLYLYLVHPLPALSPQGGATARPAGASPRTPHPVRGAVPVVPTAPLRCAICGRPGCFIRLGPVRRPRPAAPALHYDVEFCLPGRAAA